MEWREHLEAVPSFHFDRVNEPEPEGIKVEEFSVGNLTLEERSKFNDLIMKNVDMFAWDTTQLGRARLVQHSINVGDTTPIKKRWYQTSRLERAFIEEELQRMLKQGLIERSRGPWASPVVLARKKNGKLRFCVDYRALNKVTKKDEYPLPRIEDMLDTLHILLP